MARQSPDCNGSSAHLTRRALVPAMVCACCSPRLAAARQPRVGCLVRRAASGSTTVAYKASTGVAAYDRAVRETITSLETLLGRQTKAKLAFVSEFDAHYDPATHTLAFGKALLDRLQGPTFKLQLACIAAHEICHLYQTADVYFDQSLDERTVRKSELMADAFAGYCLAMVVCGKREVDNDVIRSNAKRVEAAFRLFFGLGDNNLNDPQHHGTPGERMDKVKFAYELAFKEIRGLDATGDIAYDLLDAARLIE